MALTRIEARATVVELVAAPMRQQERGLPLADAREFAGEVSEVNHGAARSRMAALKASSIVIRYFAIRAPSNYDFGTISVSAGSLAATGAATVAAGSLAGVGATFAGLGAALRRKMLASHAVAALTARIASRGNEATAFASATMLRVMTKSL
jgi:hypothetical protein